MSILDYVKAKWRIILGVLAGVAGSIFCISQAFAATRGLVIANFMHNATPWILGFLCCGWPIICIIIYLNLPKVFTWLDTLIGDEE